VVRKKALGVGGQRLRFIKKNDMGELRCQSGEKRQTLKKRSKVNGCGFGTAGERGRKLKREEKG